jgi:hypothetical protein
MNTTEYTLIGDEIDQGTMPVLKDNRWRRHSAPQLKSVGLGWVNFHVMRRTHSCLLKELDVDPKVPGEPDGPHGGHERKRLYADVARPEARGRQPA